MKVKLVEVGDGLGSVLLPLPREILKHFGWVEGDELTMEIPTAYKGTMILYKASDPIQRVGDEVI